MPTCIYPVGEGAKRVRTFLIGMIVHGSFDAETIRRTTAGDKAIFSALPARFLKRKQTASVYPLRQVLSTKRRAARPFAGARRAAAGMDCAGGARISGQVHLQNCRAAAKQTIFIGQNQFRSFFRPRNGAFPGLSRISALAVPLQDRPAFCGRAFSDGVFGAGGCARVGPLRKPAGRVKLFVNRFCLCADVFCGKDAAALSACEEELFWIPKPSC